MGYKLVGEIVSADSLKQKSSAYHACLPLVAEHRVEISNILRGDDKRLLLIVGPCSAWPIEPVLQYAERLSQLQTRFNDAVKIVMRVYTHKPRTKLGWKGLVNQPDPRKSVNIQDGIKQAHDLFVRINSMGVAVADEIIHAYQVDYFSDLFSWAAIGARTSQSQEHRILASMLDCPVGMKNAVYGPLAVNINNVVAARQSHATLHNGAQIQTQGNRDAHIVLRGSNGKPNYSQLHLHQLFQEENDQNLESIPVVIDASHDNSIVNGCRDHLQQVEVVQAVMSSLCQGVYPADTVKGFMLESFIKSGKQHWSSDTVIDTNGLSITDACLSWQQTEDLISWVAEAHRKAEVGECLTG
jgi:3-deoxy-7-phosphoheptulonate synthase